MDEISQTRFDAKPPLTAVGSSTGNSGDRLASEIWNRIDGIHRRARRLVWLETFASIISCLVVIFFIGAAFDWWVRPTSLWGRLAIFFGIMAVFLATAVWFVFRRLRHPISRIAVARRVEAVFPLLGDRLSSVVSLLESRHLDSVTSPENSFTDDKLETAAIRLIAGDLDRCEPEKRVDWRSTAQSILFAVALLSLLGLFFLWRPAGAALVTQRLLSPTSDTQWPQRNRLVLENVPESVHRGVTLEIFVRDTLGSLPDDVQLHIRRVPETRIVSTALRLAGELAVGNLTVGERDVEIRASGGDDNAMPWRRIHVFDAPSIEDYRITLFPPEYLDQAPFEVAEPEFKVLSGTGMQFEARLSLPVRSAELAMKNLGMAAEQIPLDASADGLALKSDRIPLTSTTEFNVHWRDLNSLLGESKRKWKISVEEDTVPQVVLEQPESDQEVTSAASIVVRANATDNLGLASGWLEVQHVQAGLRGRVGERTASNQTTTLSLNWDGKLSDLLNSLASSPETAETPTSSEPNPFQEGSTIELLGVAIDSAGQRGQSTTRRLRIVSKQSMQQSIARQQSQALRELLDARTQQEIALEQTQAAQARLGDSEPQKEAAADRIQAANAAQQAAARSLTESSDSARRQINEALQSAIDNALDDAALRELQEAVERASQSDLPTARSALQQAVESLMQGDVRQTEQQLSVAEDAQQATLEQLDQLVQSMRRDDSKRVAVDQLSELAASQARLNQQTRDATQAINQEIERERLAERQRELARSTEQLNESLRELIEALESQAENETTTNFGRPSGEVSNIRDALRILEQGLATDDDSQNADQSSVGSTANAMRQAAGELQRGRGGQAENLQQQIQEQLDEARRKLNGASAAPTSTDQNEREGTKPTFVNGVQQALRRQDLIVDQLQNEPTLSLKTLAAEQSSVAELTTAAAQNPDAPPGFDAALEDAVVDMKTASALMQRDTEKEAAVETAIAARERLRFITDSLLSDSKSPDSIESQPQQLDENYTDEQQQGFPTETLKLLRATQDFLRVRTEEIVRQQRSAEQPGIDPVRGARLEAQKRQLAGEQTRLLERIKQIVSDMEQNDAP